MPTVKPTYALATTLCVIWRSGRVVDMSPARRLTEPGVAGIKKETNRKIKRTIKENT
ncbi:hypothetical protein CCM_06241 [Cordyceps militaris CM01]|uniref:Uncharacterized protein n=1 Tax=Cordyceps militaris (strain CM01) TaxID=983644 RepID=G3JJJ3_CORMM|nr:uncharacterized protein CCM_06241 [Cordyceps militaris CM01]EGX92081.1 hypothetical protein CCM_06241 [Cordyceps militaris CM01]